MKIKKDDLIALLESKLPVADRIDVLSDGEIRVVKL